MTNSSNLLSHQPSTLGLLAGSDAQDLIEASQTIDCEESFLEFIRQFWFIVEPGRNFVEGRVLVEMIEHLQAVTLYAETNGEDGIRNLLMNVPPGPGWVENMVMSKRGRIRLGDVVIGDEVLTHRNRYRRVEAVHEQGIKPLLKITTWSGRTTWATPDHQYWTPGGWREARELRVGEVLAAIVPQDDCLTDLITDLEARLLGYFVGDGSVTHHPSFTNSDQDTLQDFVACCEAMGFDTKKRRCRNTWVVSVSGCREWLHKHGLLGANSYWKFIPSAVLGSSNRIVANFLGAYWSCDGMIEVRKTGKRGSSFGSSATTVSAKLAEELQHALLRFGIDARVRKKTRKLESKRQPGGEYVSYDVVIAREADTAILADFPITARKLKQAQMCRREFPRSVISDEIISIESVPDALCRCVTVEEDHSFTWSDIAVHNCMKSLLTDVFWPAWEWGPRNLAHMRYVCFSYSEDLTLRDNLRFASIVKSEKYQRRWGDRVQVTKDTESKIANTRMGWKIATSVGGVGTGERGDRVIVDDPHNVRDGESEAKRTTTLHWWREVLPTRLNDAGLSSMVVIMQRVHEEDVSGDIISRRLPFELLRLPMEFDPAFPYCETPVGGEWCSLPGELLWPERFSAEAVEGLKYTMGRYATASQLQQTPSPRGGGIIKDTDWQLWDEVYAQRMGIYDPRVDRSLPWPVMEFVIASLDTAYGQKQENDFNALTIWGVWRDENDLPKIMLMDSWKKRLTLHGTMPPKLTEESDLEYLRRCRKDWGLVEHVAYSCRRLKVDRLLIENKTKGKDVADELVRLFAGEKFATELVEAVLDKVARLYSVQHLFSQGVIFAPDKDWAEALITNTSNFPKVTHDDDVDSMSQGLRWLRDSGWALRRDERDRDVERAAMLENTRPVEPLYDV